LSFSRFEWLDCARLNALILKVAFNYASLTDHVRNLAVAHSALLVAYAAWGWIEKSALTLKSHVPFPHGVVRS
jgi:hypothetical protein